MFFFFKQKTAYEMRISDWSSDVCSSDLFYYFESPHNKINDWLVKENFKRFDAAPDFFTAQGFSQALAIAAALKKSGGSSETEDLINALEGLEFDTPKGPTKKRAEDHQDLHTMYHFSIQTEERRVGFTGNTV